MNSEIERWYLCLLLLLLFESTVSYKPFGGLNTCANLHLINLLSNSFPVSTPVKSNWHLTPLTASRLVVTKQYDCIFRYIPKMELHAKIGLTCFHKMATNFYLRKCGFNHTVIGRAWSLTHTTWFEQRRGISHESLIHPTLFSRNHVILELSHACV